MFRWSPPTKLCNLQVANGKPTNYFFKRVLTATKPPWKEQPLRLVFIRALCILLLVEFTRATQITNPGGTSQPELCVRFPGGGCNPK